MTDTQHTPGPWRIETTIYKNQPRIFGADGTFVADTDNNNARLIAAAPDLLAACQRALAEAVADDLDGWFEEMRAAIAKARGE